jgi:phosphonate transport system substrate-binding protein
MIRHIAVLALAAASFATAADEPKELNFGIIATESTVSLKPTWEPFLEDMSKAVGIPVKAFFASEYSGVIEAMRFKKVDIAWYGNKSAITAVDRAEAEIFAKVVNLEGQEGYFSYVVVHKDSPCKTIDDILAKGSELTFSLGDPQSTSGTLVPGYYIFAQRGVDPQKAFKRVTNAKHEANALAVVNKQVDAATMASDVYDRMGTSQPEKVAQLHIAWKSPLIPSDPMAWRKDLPESLKTKVRDFFLTYGKFPAEKEEVAKVIAEKEKLAKFKWSAFRASDNNQLIPIRELELAKKKAETEKDDKLSADEKKKKLDELNQQLDALKKPATK